MNVKFLLSVKERMLWQVINKERGKSQVFNKKFIKELIRFDDVLCVTVLKINSTSTV